MTDTKKSSQAKQRLALLADIPIAALIGIAGPALIALSKWRHRLPFSLKMTDRLGVAVRGHHYYEPTFNPHTLKESLEADRRLPGIDMNISGQLELMAQFDFADELKAIPLEGDKDNEYAYNKGQFQSGDAEIFYNIIRHFKPKRIVEVGSGSSTLIARLAIAQNTQDDPNYRCKHICIEPYEMPWLEQTGATIIRERVEVVGLDVIANLEADDILFVDSSHVIRAQGDVLYEVLEMYPSLASGVLVHVHDIFTPRDYLPSWVIEDRRLWTEQYILEAFLSFNSEFEILCALNFLFHNHRDKLMVACPVLVEQQDRDPGSFWFRRKKSV